MPTLKLKTGASDPAASQQPTPTTASAAEPKSAGGFKLKFSQPPTPATEQPPGTAAGNAASKKSKAGAASGQPKKPRGGGGGGGKKRAANDDISPAAKRPQPGAPSRKISIKPPGAAAAAQPGMEHIPASAGGLNRIMLKRRSTVPKLKQLNVKRPPPPRIPGVGYDSEDSDAEEDPAIQQAFILRMQPGEDCDYLREAIANGKVGVPPSEGPAEVSMRFLDKDFRRAVVTIRGRMYAAALVDLPCIVETMKSWEKKSWWKVADLNQMLLVLGRCANDDEAKNFPLPREVDKSNMHYAHGLTPPMHWVRKRRFRKRLSYKTIANVEEEVERLLREDEACTKSGGNVTTEVLDRADLEREHDPEQSMDEDADGEVLDTTEHGFDEYDDGDTDLADNLQAMFDAEDDAPLPLTTDSPAAMTERTPTFPAPADASSTPGPVADTPEVSTPAQESSGDEDEERDSDDDDDDDDDGPNGAASGDDADAKAARAERQQQLEEMRDLEREVENQRRKVEGQKNMLLRQRAEAQLRTLEEDLRVKRNVVGVDGEGEEGAGDADAGLFGDDGGEEEEDAEGESEEE